MLHPNCNRITLIGKLTTEPFIDYDGQGILVAGRDWLTLKLFRGHIGCGACIAARAH